jgi:hypothetical protein
VRLKNLVGSLAFGAALVAAASTASAQGRGNGMPLNYVDRPLTVPAGTLVPQVEYDIDHVPGPVLAPNTTLPTVNGPTSSTATYAHFMNFGATIGLAPNFEVQSTFLPLELSPNRQYGSPEVAATLRLAKGQTELGARMAMTFNTVPVVTFKQQGLSTVKETSLRIESTTLEPGLPIILRFHHQARIDTGLFADFTVGQSVQTQVAGGTLKSPNTVVGLKLPVDLSVATAKNAYLGIGSGFKIDDLRQSQASFSMPLKLYAGFSWGTRRHPYVDVVPYFSWDHLITPGQQTPQVTETGKNPPSNTLVNDTTHPVQPTTATTAGPQETFHWDAWQFGLQLRGYLHFM